MRRVEPAAALVGDIAVPGVKGLCQRAAILAAVADGVSEIRGFGHAADTDVALEVVRALGRRGERAQPGHDPNRGSRDARAAGAGRSDRLQERRHAAAPALRGAGRSERALRADAATSRSRAARTSASPSRCARWAPRWRRRTARRRSRSRAASSAGQLRAAGGERPGEVGDPSRRAVRCGRADHRGRAGADARPHRADADLARACASAARAAEISVWPVERIPPLDVDIPGDFSSAAPFLVGAVASGRLRAAHPRRQSESRPAPASSTCSSGWARA